MKLIEGTEKNTYKVCNMELAVKTAKRLEALGMIKGTKISVLNKKPSAMIITIRGTRFALGKAIAQNIEVEA